ncbi:MAG: hypothetical protein QOJ97_1300, partial [Solirubrobacteraceae bacterium]|nr:hypothetical protein [Solirubrobacteraceae bacterium]
QVHALGLDFESAGDLRRTLAEL